MPLIQNIFGLLTLFFIFPLAVLFFLFCISFINKLYLRNEHFFFMLLSAVSGCAYLLVYVFYNFVFSVFHMHSLFFSVKLLFFWNMDD